MCEQNNLKDLFVTNLKLKGFLMYFSLKIVLKEGFRGVWVKESMCEQNNLNDLFVTNLKLKGLICIYPL